MSILFLYRVLRSNTAIEFEVTQVIKQRQEFTVTMEVVYVSNALTKSKSRCRKLVQKPIVLCSYFSTKLGYQLRKLTAKNLVCIAGGCDTKTIHTPRPHKVGRTHKKKQGVNHTIRKNDATVGQTNQI